MSQSFYPPTRPLTVGEVLDLVIQIFKATVVRCLPYGICAVIAQELPNIYELGNGTGAVRQPFGGGHPIWIVLFVVGTLLSLIAWSALLLRQRAIVEHLPTSTRSELVQTLRRLPSFVTATVLVFVAVGSELAILLWVPRQYHTGALVSLGVLSFYVAILLSCTWPAVLLGGRGPLGALRQSVRLVWGNWWRAMAIYVVGAVTVLVLGILVGILIALVVPTLIADIPVMWATFTVIANGMVAVVAPFVCALLLAVFGDLRVRKEGADLQQRIAGLALE
jgi:hypothetical protein